MSNIYSLHGINFRCFYEIPFLKNKNGVPSVFIKKGVVPQNVKRVIKKGVLYEIGENELIFSINEIARFHISNGAQIIIEPVTNDYNEITPFLLGAIFGGLLLQKKILALHANTIYKGNKAILLSGHSGAGKSTLSALMLNHNYKFLADDISSINFLNGVPSVNKGLLSIKLWEDSLEKLNIINNNLQPVRKNLKKVRYPVIFDNSDKNVEVHAMIILKSENNENFKLKKITGIKKFTQIQKNIYRKQFIVGKELELWQFKECSQLASKIDVYELTRPAKGFYKKQLAKMVEKVFNH